MAHATCGRTVNSQYSVSHLMLSVFHYCYYLQLIPGSFTSTLSIAAINFVCKITLRLLSGGKYAETVQSANV